MGAIGTRPFENDAAIDWLMAAPPEKISSAFDAAVSPTLNVIERSTTVAEQAVAAIAVLAFANTKDSDIGELLSRLDINHDDVNAMATPERLQKAVQILEHLQTVESTLSLEWQDSGLLRQWKSELSNLFHLVTMK